MEKDTNSLAKMIKNGVNYLSVHRLYSQWVDFLGICITGQIESALKGSRKVFGIGSLECRAGVVASEIGQASHCLPDTTSTPKTSSLTGMSRSDARTELRRRKKQSWKDPPALEVESKSNHKTSCQNPGMAPGDLQGPFHQFSQTPVIFC